MMHPNEIELTPENIADVRREAVLLDELDGFAADELGPHRSALFTQVRRQTMERTDRIAEREIRP